MAALWYVAYGSNMDPRLLARYVDPDRVRASRWVRVPRVVWFGGRSRRWTGGVAFLSLVADPQAEPRWCHAHLVEESDLVALYRGENGYLDVDPGPLDHAPGEWRRGGFPLSRDGTRGKYDALLRLVDLDGVPAYSITTGRRLRRTDPTPGYLQVIEDCLAGSPGRNR